MPKNAHQVTPYWQWIERVIASGRYRVTKDGRVFSGERELVAVYRDGYLRVRLSADGRRERVCVHVLVALAYRGPRPSLRHEVRHLDGSRDNNRASNLAWGTWEDNVADRCKHGKSSRGRSHGVAVRLGKFKAGFARAVKS